MPCEVKTPRTAKGEVFSKAIRPGFLQIVAISFFKPLSSKKRPFPRNPCVFFVVS